jgi:hypothetical protein
MAAKRVAGDRVHARWRRGSGPLPRPSTTVSRPRSVPSPRPTDDESTRPCNLSRSGPSPRRCAARWRRAMKRWLSSSPVRGRPRVARARGAADGFERCPCRRRSAARDPILAAAPSGTDRRVLGQEASAIRSELKRGGCRERIELVTWWAVEPLDLLREAAQQPLLRSGTPATGGRHRPAGCRAGPGRNDLRG